MNRLTVFKNLNKAGSYDLYASETGYAIPILYEDNHILIVVKPAGVLSQSDGSGAPDILTILKEYIGKKYNKPGAVFLGLVHRLDRPVSGVMVFARTSKAASRISEQIRDKNVTKCYYAIVHHALPARNGRLQSKLVKNAFNIVSEDEDGKEAVLYYDSIGYNKEKDLSLTDIRLETGRSHQIRVQLSQLGNPILGDKKYGDPAEKYQGDITLFSHSFLFKHPTKEIEMKAEVIPFYKKEWNLFKREFEALEQLFSEHANDADLSGDSDGEIRFV